MDTSNWLLNKINELEEKTQGINPSDFRFYNIAHLPIIAKRTVELSEICENCKLNIQTIDQLIDSLPQCLENNAINRKHFEENKNKLENHLRKQHKCHFPGYYAAIGSLIGFLLGILTAVFLAFFTTLPLFNKLSLIALAVFLMTGRWLGIYIDKNVFKNNLQL